MKMSFLFLVDSALQKDADNIPPKKLTAILLRSEIYRLISLPACSGTHIQGMHPLLHCISLVAIFAIIPFMPPWRQIFSSIYYPQFDNKGDIIPGSFVEIFLLSSPMENVISLPHTALTEEQGSFFVYLQVDEEGYKKQLVTLGADNGERVQILSGIKAGNKVVTQGAYQVKLAGATNAIPAHSHEH